LLRVVALQGAAAEVDFMTRLTSSGRFLVLEEVVALEGFLSSFLEDLRVAVGGAKTVTVVLICGMIWR
jgi:hypothetical protein